MSNNIADKKVESKSNCTCVECHVEIEKGFLCNRCYGRIKVNIDDAKKKNEFWK